MASYGIEYDKIYLCSLRTEDKPEYFLEDPDIDIILYSDISNLQQFTKIIKKEVIESNSHITEIDNGLPGNNNKYQYVIISSMVNPGLLKLKFLNTDLLYQQGNNGYRISYTSTSTHMADTDLYTIGYILGNIIQSLNN